MNTPETRTVPTDLSGYISNTVRRAGLYIAVLLVLLITAVIAPQFFAVSNLLNVSRQAAVLMIVSVGQLLVLLVGGVDLSVGSVMTTATVVTGEITGGLNGRLIEAIPICILIGIVMAYLNIFLILKRNVPPFVATLGTYILMEGARLLYTKGVP